MSQIIGLRSVCKQTAILSKTNATLATIPGLTFTMPAGSTYILDAQIGVTAAAAPGQQTALIGMDTGTVETWFEAVAAAAVVCAKGQSHDGGAAAFAGVVRYRGYIRNITAAPVTFAFQAAQSVVDASAVVFENGFLQLTQV